MTWLGGIFTATYRYYQRFLSLAGLQISDTGIDIHMDFLDPKEALGMNFNNPRGVVEVDFQDPMGILEVDFPDNEVV